MRKKIKAEKPMRVEVVGLGPWEKRIIGILLTITGLTLLALGIHLGQVKMVLEAITRGLRAPLAGLR